MISSVEFNIHRLSLQYEAEHDAAGEQGKGKERGQDVRRLCREKKKKKSLLSVTCIYQKMAANILVWSWALFQTCCNYLRE